MSVDEAEFLSQLHRWRDEAEKRFDCRVSRICVAYEAGRDGFWLAHCLRDSGIEAHVMHSTSIPVKQDHRRAKTDRLDCQLMMRAFPGWLRRKAGHCRMVAVPTARQEDARRVTRERKGLVREQTKLINRLKALFACKNGVIPCNLVLLVMVDRKTRFSQFARYSQSVENIARFLNYPGWPNFQVRIVFDLS